MSKLEDNVREEGLRLAKGALFMGEPLEEFDRTDLLAIAALGWHAVIAERGKVEEEIQNGPQ